MPTLSTNAVFPPSDTLELLEYLLDNGENSLATEITNGEHLSSNVLDWTISDSDCRLLETEGPVTFDIKGSNNAELFWCTGYEEYHNCRDETTAPNGDPVCDDYYCDNYYSCDQCGCEGDRDSSMYHEGSGQTVCEDCYYELGSDESDHFNGRSKTFDGSNNFGSSRSFGIELETNNGKASSQFAFDGKGDGSIRGIEFVSHILRGSAGLEELRDFMASSEDIEYAENCGVHVHINMRDLTSDQRYAVYLGYLVNQDYFENMFPDRMGASYVGPHNSGESVDLIANYLEGIDYNRFASRGGRYHWINACSIVSHGTIENRLHPASWDYEAMRGWVIFNLRFVRALQGLTIEPAETVASFKAKTAACMEYAGRIDSLAPGETTPQRAVA